MTEGEQQEFTRPGLETVALTKKQEAELEVAEFYWERSEWISSEYMRGTFPAE